MSDRLSCCVPYCRCTTKRNVSEWICGKHWRLVPRKLRSDYASAKRIARRLVARKPAYREWWAYPGGSSNRLAAVALRRRLDRLWDRCKTAAIEGAAGI